MRFGKIAAAVAALLGLAAAPNANAAYIAYMYQDGANVVVTGSGSLNLSGIAYTTSGTAFFAQIGPTLGFLSVGSGNDDAYQNQSISSAITFPSFGSGTFTQSDSETGGFVSIGHSSLGVPAGYVSGQPLGTSTATWNNTTLSALGVTPGTYVGTLGSGTNADTFTLYAGTNPVPEPASLALLATGLLGLGISRRRAG